MSPRSRNSNLASAAVAAAAAVVLLATLGGCSEEKEPEKAAPIDAANYAAPQPWNPRAESGPQAPKVPFDDATEGSGFAFTHVNGMSEDKYLPETMGAGVVMLDFDGDGRLDLFCVQGKEWPGKEKLKPAPTCKLFRNVGGFKFEDVSAGSGLDVTLLGMGGAAADYDGDGDPDLFVTALGPCRLFRNDSAKGADGKVTARFVDVTAEAGITTPTWTDSKGLAHPCWSTGAAWLDYDCDGVLDLFVCQYVHWSIENDVVETLNGLTKAYTKPTRYDADTCRLLHGKSDGTFEDVTKAMGVERPDAKALGCAVADLNDDGKPDVAVSNDTQPNFLFVSQPDGKFAEVANDAGMAYDANGRARAGMGIDVADLRDDGCYVVSIGNFSGEPISMYTQTKDRLFFVDRAGAAHVAAPTNLLLKFGVLFTDYDLDGALDIFVVNGHIEPEINSVTKDVSYAEPTQLFWNRGDGVFVETSLAAGKVFARRVVGRGVACGDLDQDGDVDFVMTQNGRDAILIRNDQELGHGWLRTRLVGSGRNRQALGATVTLALGPKKMRREVRTGSSYLSQSDVAPTFGLGPKPPADVAVEVRWPSGKTEKFEGLAANREHVLVEGKGRS